MSECQPSIVAPCSSSVQGDSTKFAFKSRLDGIKFVRMFSLALVQSSDWPEELETVQGGVARTVDNPDAAFASVPLFHGPRSKSIDRL